MIVHGRVTAKPPPVVAAKDEIIPTPATVGVRQPGVERIHVSTVPRRDLVDERSGDATAAPLPTNMGRPPLPVDVDSPGSGSSAQRSPRSRLQVVNMRTGSPMVGLPVSTPQRTLPASRVAPSRVLRSPPRNLGVRQGSVRSPTQHTRGHVDRNRHFAIPINTPSVRAPERTESGSDHGYPPSPSPNQLPSPPRTQHPNMAPRVAPSVAMVRNQVPAIPLVSPHPLVTHTPHQSASLSAEPQHWMSPTDMPAKRTRPNYSSMTPEEQTRMRNSFDGKFDTLRISFPTWQVTTPPATSSLDHIHDVYENYVRKIVVSINSSQWKIYLVIMFLFIEVVGIKVFSLDMRGYTMSQVRTMHRFDQILVELGEKYYVQGPSNWPVEARICLMAGFNALVFVIIKYLCRYAGEGYAEPIQGAIDTFLGGGPTFQPAARDDVGIPIPPGMQTGTTTGNTTTATGVGNGATMGLGSDPMAAIGNIMSRFMGAGGMNALGGGSTASGGSTGGGSGGEGGFDISRIVASIGNAFTANMAPVDATASSGGGSGAPPRRMPVWSE